MWTGDPVRDYEIHDAEQTAWLAKRPICADCGEPIQDEQAYYINDEWICPDCMDSYLVVVEEYIE